MYAIDLRDAQLLRSDLSRATSRDCQVGRRAVLAGRSANDSDLRPRN